MNLEALIHPNSDANALLLQRAQIIMGQLPEPFPGSQICLAFGCDREALAAALIGTWMKGHGAAIVENSLRERIMPVLDRPCVALLLHDTESGRDIQIPRLLASAALPKAAAELPNVTTKDLLTLHVQTEDGQEHWCTWSPQELVSAIDDLAGQLQASPASPQIAPQTPGLLSSFFANTLIPLQQGIALGAHQPIDARRFRIRSAPDTATDHQQEIDALLNQDGITDAVIVVTSNKQTLTAIAGPGADKLAAMTANSRAFAKIPRDPNSQPLAAEIFLAFGLGRAGQVVTRELNWTTLPHNSASVAMRTTVPDNYLFYEGHFTTYPVLAGGVQLHEVVLPCLQKVFGTTPAITQIDGLKFLTRIAPGDTIDIILTPNESAQQVTFELRKGNKRCTVGQLQFAAALPAFQSPPTS